MNIGYAWVSTKDQNPNLQLSALKQRIFADKATGTHTQRPELAKCLKALNNGDTLTIWKLGRLSLSLLDLISLLENLKALGMVFRSLTEAIDAMTPTGHAMWQILASSVSMGSLTE